MGLSSPAGGEPVCYEGYGPGGTAVLVECLTDDREQLSAALRRAFARHGGHLGAEGSVSYIFDTVGVLTYPPGTDRQGLTQAALAAGAEDVVPHDDTSVEVLADPRELPAVRAMLELRGFAPASAEVMRRAATSIPLSGETAELMLRLIEALEELPEVREVYANVEIADEVLARL